jgi:hypothetical protein
MMMNFYCSEKHDKTNWFDSDWGTRQNKITRAKPQNNSKYGEGHTDHEEAQAGEHLVHLVRIL